MFSQLRYVQDQLARLTYAEWRQVADGSSVPFSTVRKVGSRTTLNPRSQTVDKIAAYFRVKEKRK
jgi:hypothetical protein